MKQLSIPISFPCLFFYVTLIAAFTGPHFLSFDIGGAQVFPYRVCLLIIWFLFVLSIFTVKKKKLDITHLMVKKYLQFLFFWLLYGFFSIAWAEDKDSAVKEIIFLFSGISLVFFNVYYFYQKKHLRWLFGLWIVIFMALIPIAVWEITTGNHLALTSLFGSTETQFLFMPSTIFFNPNDYASFIALTLSMLLAFVRYTRKKYFRLLGIALIIAGLSIMAMTLARACFIAVGLAWGVWFIFLLPRGKKFNLLVKSVLLLIIAFGFFPDYFLYIFEIAAGKINFLIPLLTGDVGNDGSVAVRSNLIRNGIKFIVDSFGIGIGAGNSDYYMTHSSHIYPTRGIIKLHNWWLEIFVNYGMFIFWGYIIFYGSLLFNYWRVYKLMRDQEEKMLCEAILLGLISFLITSISSSSIIAFPPQWIYTGFALAFLNYVRIKSYGAKENVL